MDKHKAHSHKYDIGDRFYYGHGIVEIVGFACGDIPSAYSNVTYTCVSLQRREREAFSEAFLGNLRKVRDHEKEREKKEQEKRELEQKVSFYREKLIEHLSSLLVTADNEHDAELIRETVDSVIIHIKTFDIDCTEEEYRK